jgi:hypothetical protein
LILNNNKTLCKKALLLLLTTIVADKYHSGKSTRQWSSYVLT